MIDFLSMETWVLILYSTIGALIAVFLYDLADILSTKEKRQRFKANFLAALHVFKNPKHKEKDKDKK